MSDIKKHIRMETIYDWTKSLINKIKEDSIEKDIDIIVPLLRGGLIPAGFLSYALENRNIEPIDISTYDSNNSNGHMERQKIVNHVHYQVKNIISALPEKPIKNILIVDDLVDSGETFEIVYEAFENTGRTDINLISAVLYQNLKVDFIADYCGYSEHKEHWLVFPWDDV